MQADKVLAMTTAWMKARLQVDLMQGENDY